MAGIARDRATSDAMKFSSLCQPGGCLDARVADRIVPPFRPWDVTVNIRGSYFRGSS